MIHQNQIIVIYTVITPSKNIVSTTDSSILSSSGDLSLSLLRGRDAIATKQRRIALQWRRIRTDAQEWMDQVRATITRPAHAMQILIRMMSGVDDVYKYYLQVDGQDSVRDAARGGQAKVIIDLLTCDDVIISPFWQFSIADTRLSLQHGLDRREDPSPEGRPTHSMYSNTSRRYGRWDGSRNDFNKSICFSSRMRIRSWLRRKWSRSCSWIGEIMLIRHSELINLIRIRRRVPVSSFHWPARVAKECAKCYQYLYRVQCCCISCNNDEKSSI